jgi:hypothetical protein
LAGLSRRSGRTALPARSGSNVHRGLVPIGDGACTDNDCPAVTANAAHSTDATISAGAAISPVTTEFAVVTISAAPPLATILAFASSATWTSTPSFCRERDEGGERVDFNVERSSMCPRPARSTLTALDSGSTRATRLSTVVVDPIAVGVVARNSTCSCRVEIESSGTFGADGSISNDLRHLDLLIREGSRGVGYFVQLRRACHSENR